MCIEVDIGWLGVVLSGTNSLEGWKGWHEVSERDMYVWKKARE